MLFALAGMAIGAGMNYLAAQEENEATDKQRDTLRGAMVSAGDVRRDQQFVNRSFNAEILAGQNQMALNTRGADASLTQAASFGAGIASKIRTQADVQARADATNVSLTKQMAGLRDTNETAAVISGGIEGGIAGAQISDLIGQTPEVDSLDFAPSTDIAPDAGLDEMAQTDIDLSPRDEPIKTKGIRPGGSPIESRVPNDIIPGRDRIPIQEYSSYEVGQPFQDPLKMGPGAVYGTSRHAQDVDADLARNMEGDVTRSARAITDYVPPRRRPNDASHVKNETLMQIFQGGVNAVGGIR